MTIDIRPYTEAHVKEVKAFNRRLAERGVAFQFPESPVPRWLPRQPGVPVYQEYFVALEGDTVHGTYGLKPQAFWIQGKSVMLSSVQLPISEGIVDPRYKGIGIQLLRDAMARQSLMFGLGGGGVDRPLPRLLKYMRWYVVECPFYFRVLHPFRFLREIVVLRDRPARRLLLDALAFSGLGWVGLKGVHAWRGRRGGVRTELTTTVVDGFSGWVDAVWEQVRGSYAMAAVRDETILKTLYPASDPRFIRLRLDRAGVPVGWAVLLDTPMTAHSQFGRMRVGTVVDCLAVPGAEDEVVAAATRHLRGRGVDLIVSNQMHRAWGEAFLRNGYLCGPSNFIFSASPALVALLEPIATNLQHVHLNRGDGDGPINL